MTATDSAGHHAARRGSVVSAEAAARLAVSAYEALQDKPRLIVACPTCGRKLAEVYETSRGPLFVGKVPPHLVAGQKRSAGVNTGLELELLTDDRYLSAAHGGCAPEPTSACPKGCAEWHFDTRRLVEEYEADTHKGHRRRVVATDVTL